MTPRISQAGNRPCKRGGFTYLLVLAMVVALGISAQGLSTLSSHAASTDREAELLFRGQAYQRAIGRYFDAGHPNSTYPTELEHLLEDSRFLKRRHIRSLYADPMGGPTGEWRLILHAGGGIMGVASSSQKAPRKSANFPLGLEAFEEAKSYADWEFVYQPKVPVLK